MKHAGNTIDKKILFSAMPPPRRSRRWAMPSAQGKSGAGRSRCRERKRSATHAAPPSPQRQRAMKLRSGLAIGKKRAEAARDISRHFHDDAPAISYHISFAVVYLPLLLAANFHQLFLDNRAISPRFFNSRRSAPPHSTSRAMKKCCPRRHYGGDKPHTPRFRQQLFAAMLSESRA